MIKWLLVIGVIAFVYFVFIKKSTPLKQANEDEAPKRNKEEVDEMVQCAKCGIYVELDEAIVSNGKYFCSQECLKG